MFMSDNNLIGLFLYLMYMYTVYLFVYIYVMTLISFLSEVFVLKGH